MVPKVCGKLLTTHRRGLGVDVEALRDRFPSGGAPEKAPRWDLTVQKVAAVEIGFRGAPGCFQGMQVYIGEGSRSRDPRGAHKGGGAPTPLGRTLDPRGRLVYFLTSTPSLLDHVCSKNKSPEGFIPFGHRLIFLFFETLK